MHVIGVDRDEDAGMLTVRVESPPAPMGCRSCGVVAHSHGRREVVLVDAPCFDRPVKLVWRKRTWRCGEPSCPAKPGMRETYCGRPVNEEDWVTTSREVNCTACARAGAPKPDRPGRGS